MKQTAADPLTLDIRLVDTGQSLLAEDEERLLATLSPDERARHARFRKPEDQKRYLLCRSLLREVLAEALGCEPEEVGFTSNAWGKPGLAETLGSDIQFNLSHAPGLGVAVFTHGAEVGVDVEDTRRTVDQEGIAGRYFSDTEKKWLATLTPVQRHEAFFSLWTLKEAMGKAMGKGLAHTLDAARFRVEEGKITASLHDPQAGSAEHWRFLRFSSGEHHQLAVALRSASPLELVCQAWYPDREGGLARIDYIAGS